MSAEYEDKKMRVFRLLLSTEFMRHYCGCGNILFEVVKELEHHNWVESQKDYNDGFPASSSLLLIQASGEFIIVIIIYCGKRFGWLCVCEWGGAQIGQGG